MRAMVRHALVLCCLVAVLLAPRAASAITIDQVLSLAKAGVTDTVILALIDRDRTVFAIEPEQIVSLQRDGLSERVILAMLKSGRAEGEQAARADAAANAAWIATNLATEPLTVTVGHGPDRPNTPHIDGFYSGPPVSAFAIAPYYAPTFRYRKPSTFGTQHSADLRGNEPRDAQPRAFCYAQVGTRASANAGSFVTECPAFMQPSRR
jgi:hypothetical protein